MTVSELIEQLMQQPQDWEVDLRLYDDEHGGEDYGPAESVYKKLSVNGSFERVIISVYDDNDG